MSLSKAFSKQPRAFIVAEMVALLVVIGILDIITGYEIRLLPFYAAPVFVISWFCGKKMGIVGGLVGGLVSLAADWMSHDPDLSGWTESWEVARHLGTCLVIALVGSALKAKSEIAAGRIALLERSQRLEHQIVNISDAEQRRIGRDLHDGLCQYLAALTCSATSLRDDLQQLQLPAEAKAADEVARLLQDAVVQTRDLARGLIPAHVGNVGLSAALESLAQSVTRLHGVTCKFQFRGELANCDARIATHLYRIAQEAINNATRHGKARNIAISLDAADHRLTLGVLDDGVGISNRGEKTGMGLAIMDCRARLTGGELKIEQPTTGGTMISCTARTDRRENEIAAA